MEKLEKKKLMKNVKIISKAARVKPKREHNTKTHTQTHAMTEEEDEDFYVRYYVVRAFRVSFSFFLSLLFFLLSSSSSHFLCVCAISIFPIAKLYAVYAFFSLCLSVFLCDSDG